MKKSILIFLALAIIAITCFVVYAQKPSLSQNSGNWEYACFVYSQDILAAWTLPEKTISDKTIFNLYKKLGIKTKGFPFPPEFPILNYAGNQGWELINYSSREDSTTGYYVYWFKRKRA